MIRPLLLLTLTAASLAAGTVAADVYKYKDEKGNIQYTDKPPVLPAERLNVQSQKTDIVAAQARSQAAVRANTPPPPSQDNPPEEEPKATPEQTAKDNADHCAKARERYDKYMNSQRLYEPGANGERRYLSDAELDAARASAKASMDVLCK